MAAGPGSSGERIAQARRAAGLSRGQLAQTLGLRLWDVEQIESGRSEPPDELLRRIAEAIGVSPLWLRTGADVLQLDDRRTDDLAARERLLEEREKELAARETELRRREAAVAAREARVEAAQAPAPAVSAAARGLPGSVNVNTLARLVAAHGASYPDRVEEWQATLVAMRNVTGTDGRLTPQLEELARDVFAPLLRGAA